MSWEIAAVLLGVLGTIAVAIIRFVPQRTVVKAANGERCATKDDIVELKQAVRDHDRYTKERNHDILNAFGTVSATLQLINRDIAILMDRSQRASNDHD
jgi:hypothetical protein